MEALLSEPFFSWRMKRISRPNGFMLCGKLGVDLLSNSEWLYSNMNIRLRLIRAGPAFYMISENPNVSLGIVHCSIYTRRIDLKHDYHKKQIYMLTYTPVEFTTLKLLQSRSSFQPDKICLFKKTFSATLHFVGLLLQ